MRKTHMTTFLLSMTTFVVMTAFLFNSMLVSGLSFHFILLLGGVCTFAILSVITIYLATQKPEVEIIPVEKDKREATTEGQTEEEKIAREKSKKLEAAEKLYTEVKQIISEKGVGSELLSAVSKGIGAGQSILYHHKQNHYQIKETFAYFSESKNKMYEVGEGLVGQAGKAGKVLYINEVPEGYTTIISGLGDTQPRALSILPLGAKEQEAPFVIEAAFLTQLEDIDKEIISSLLDSIGEALSEDKVVENS